MDNPDGGNDKERGESPMRAKKRGDRDDSQGSLGYHWILGIRPKRRRYDPQAITQDHRGVKSVHLSLLQLISMTSRV